MGAAAGMAPLKVEDGEAEFIELAGPPPDPDPVIPPVAPAASMRDWTVFSLKQPIV